MRPLFGIASLRPPKGLAARAVLFISGLILITALAVSAAFLVGAQRESERRQSDFTAELAQYLAAVSGAFMQASDGESLQRLVVGASARDHVRRLSVRDLSGHVVADSGGGEADAATLDRLARQVLTTGQPSHLRAADGALAAGAPFFVEGRPAGVALMMWDRGAYYFDPLPSLAPLLIILACLVLSAIPLTTRVVRRMVAPLDQLVEFAERVAERGEASAPIDINTGDEIESLARALNNMMARLDLSMRRIQEIAFVDPVTQLPNQERLAREIDLAIARSHGEGAELGGVAVFELQRLARVSQTLDPSSERELLRAVASRLGGAARTVDRVVASAHGDNVPAIAARLGPAEFAVFAPGLSATDAARFGQHLNAVLNQPFEWRGHALTLGVTCGIAVLPRDGRDAESVIRRARMAASAAHSAPNRLKLFTPSLDREAVARMTLEREMRGALERNEFRAFFQPKISLQSGRIEACEALARWVRPDKTIIGPARFVPIAEESGLIGALSDAIMREACWKAAAWARAGHAASVAVNVSALQFRNDRFAEQVLRIVEHAGLAPQRLELEITETVVLEDPERALAVIRPLREAGVRLAIDDFGCGHSNLAALSKLPFDVIKIDQQFIRALERGDAQAPAIIDMILALASTLGMEVVAEGVERREEAEFMAARGCRWVQGFLYGAAVSAPEFAELMQAQARDAGPSVDAA